MSRYIQTCTWADVPHISAEEQADLLKSTPPYLRDARSKGVPQLGSGAVYQFPESDLRVPDFEIPRHWRRWFGLDIGIGSHPTACTWQTFDPESSTLYVYNAYRRVSSETALHIAAVKDRGAWIRGVGDAAGLIVTEYDAEQLVSVFQRGGIDVELPDKAVESGVLDVWNLMSAGRFKVFASCAAWFEEYRLYRRDDKGRIVKAHDDLMDATRYGVRSGQARGRSLAEWEQSQQQPDSGRVWPQGGDGSASWMGA